MTKELPGPRPERSLVERIMGRFISPLPLERLFNENPDIRRVERDKRGAVRITQLYDKGLIKVYYAVTAGPEAVKSLGPHLLVSVREYTPGGEEISETPFVSVMFRSKGRRGLRAVLHNCPTENYPVEETLSVTQRGIKIMDQWLKSPEASQRRYQDRIIDGAGPDPVFKLEDMIWVQGRRVDEVTKAPDPFRVVVRYQ